MEVRMKCRGVCAFLAEKSRATNYIICVFERQPGRSHVWPGGCRRRDPSSCLRAVKWSRWRAAEEDIIQRLIILSGSRRALCFAGCRRWRGGGPRPNIRCHSQRQWMDNGHPSIFHASLSHGLEPTTMSISKQFDPFSWLIHQPDLICNPDRFPKESRVGFRGEDERKNIESEGNQWPAVQNIARSAVGERWSLSQYHGGSFISLMDCLSVSPEQTCIWVAGGKFGGVLFSGAVAQACTSPSANWPRRVIRT